MKRTHTCTHALPFIAIVLLLGLPSCGAMSRAAALKQLGLVEGFSPEELRAAYRITSLTAHPDKGGTTAAFIRVARAYELLSKEASSSSSSSSSSSFDFDGSFDEAAMQALFKQAEQMFEGAIDELLAMDGDGAAAMVDKLFEKRTGVVSWLIKSGLKAGARWLVPKVQQTIESENTVLEVGGHKFTGAEFKAWRDGRQRRQKAEERMRNGKPADEI
jgi:hypothetical protein